MGGFPIFGEADPFAPSLDLNFLSGALDPRLSFARASGASYFDSTGTRQDAASGVPRFDYDPSTLSLFGTRMEEQRSNQITNPRAEGGSAGTPGTAPTGWVVSNASGLSSQMVGFGTENGVAYAEIRLFGTISSSGLHSNIQFVPNNTTIAAVQNDVWTHALYVRQTAGSNSSIISMGARLDNYTAGGAFLNGNGVNVIPSGAGLATQRQSITYSPVEPTTAFITPSLIIFWFASGAVDVTYRVGVPTCEKGSWGPTTAILPPPGSPAVSTRAVDTLSMPLAPWFNSVAGTIVAEGLWEFIPGAGGHDVYMLSDAGANNQLQLYNQIGQTNAFSIVKTAGTLVINGSLGSKTITNKVPFKHALTWNAAGAYTDAANGVLGSSSTVAVPSGMTTLYLGADSLTNNSLAECLRRFRFFPFAFTPAQLTLVTT